MDHYTGMDRQRGLNSPAGSPATLLPVTHHGRSSSASTALLTKNVQAKAAAQRLAKVMSHRSGSQDDEDEDEDEEDLALEHSSTGLGLSAGRAHRPRPSVPVRATAEHIPSARMLSTGVHPSLSNKTKEQPSVGSATSAMSSSQPAASTVQPFSSHAIPATGRTSVSMNPSEKNPSGKSPVDINQVERSPRVLNAAVRRPRVLMKLGAFVSPSATTAFKQQNRVGHEVPDESQKDIRSSMEVGNVDSLVSKEHNHADLESRDSSVLQDEVDMLQEDNESLLVKLRLAEQRYEEAEARAKQLENQVAAVGERVSLEARLQSRKKAALQKRETTKGEATSALEQLQESELELRALRSTVQRLVLTQEEMEEVVLKRCWLSRYWGLCTAFGIHPDIAESKHEYWSSWAPLPFEIVVAAGEDAKQDREPVHCQSGEREKIVRDFHRISGESNAESMIMVEKGLRELASLKVEDAVLLKMAQRRERYLQKTAFSDETISPTEQTKICDSFELSPEESEDVQFKLAWLIYFWRRAKTHGLEDDIAEDRLQTWIDQSSHQPTSRDAIGVECGMTELRKLGIETSLWEESRSWIE